MPDDPAAALVARLAARALHGHRLTGFERLHGGVINDLYRIHAGGFSDPFVLRIYKRDRGACRKEVDLHRLVGASVPVPEILYGECEGDEETPPFIVMRWVDGVSFREIKRRGDSGELAECARAMGAALARIGAFTFERAGSIGSGLTVGAPLIESIPKFVETCLSSPHFERRMSLHDRNRLRAYIAGWETEFTTIAGERSLVHSDFGSPNILLRGISGRWSVAAVLDWEFAFAGPPLIDVGHMMRYEWRNPRIEPHFSTAFREHGGRLRENWRDFCRALDLTALCEFLARPALPSEAASEILELALATIDDH